MKNTLIEYVRVDRGPQKGQLKGVVVSTGPGKIGWSCVNTKAGDTFDKKRGLEIALARTESGSNKKVPHDVVRVVARMASRTTKYFKPVVFEA